MSQELAMGAIFLFIYYGITENKTTINVSSYS